eukprot:8604055-Prorocentrum_lima.AAC.1
MKAEHLGKIASREAKLYKIRLQRFTYHQLVRQVAQLQDALFKHQLPSQSEGMIDEGNPQQNKSVCDTD